MKAAEASGRRILIAEDEESMAKGLVFNLKEEGYDVSWAPDGKKALDLFGKRQFDLVILDVMLPYRSGFEVARHIRTVSAQTPILFLTAVAGAADKVTGLEIGADDYLTKPFHLEELLLRVSGMFRRKSWYRDASSVGPTYELGEWKIDFEALACTSQGKSFRMTERESNVLRHLIEHRGRVVPRAELLEQVWKLNKDTNTRTIDAFIVRLRKRFERDPARPRYFRSVRGVGYMFVDEVPP